MSIFAHLTRNIYRKFLKLGAQIRQRMEEKAKSLKKHVMSWTLIIHHCFQW